MCRFASIYYRCFVWESWSPRCKLGTVELTVALHYVFNTPYDRIVWDVGHQAYGHKILTGRKDIFHTLRKFKGISGFPNPAESEYDAFIAGHASNSISAAMGMSVASALKKELDRHVIAVIGDALWPEDSPSRGWIMRLPTLIIC